MDKEIKKRLQQGEAPITLSFLPDDVIGVSGMIHINASPEKVWTAITDYDNLSSNLPKVISSRIISRDGNEIVLEQTGKTGILIFEKTVHFRLKAREEYLKKVSFEQLDGDFRIYRGEWNIETYPEIQGTVLFYKAEIKPVFFAPPILVSFVQYQDLPGILKAHKKRAETL
ncbi:MAG: cyclase [Chlorobiaceae bacterium]|jgi:carbon monoxide dehydrogenase subunit G|nr:cyclase [Chlorobiaceae bacterium]